MRSAIIIPTRDRIDQLIEVLRCMKQRDTKSVVFVGVDDDQFDDHQRAFESLPEDTRPRVMRFAFTGKVGVAAKLNEMAMSVSEHYHYILFGANDVFPITHQWDSILIASIRQVPFGVSYPHDSIQGPNLPSNGTCFDTRFIKANGWFCLPGLAHMYVDNVWKDLSERSGVLRYCPHVQLDHRHPCKDQRYNDSLYVQTSPLLKTDKVVYRRWLSTGGLQRSVFLLRQQIEQQKRLDPDGLNIWDY